MGAARSSAPGAALITGAGTGTGRALAVQLAREGWTIAVRAMIPALVVILFAQRGAVSGLRL